MDAHTRVKSSLTPTNLLSDRNIVKAHKMYTVHRNA